MLLQEAQDSPRSSAKIPPSRPLPFPQPLLGHFYWTISSNSCALPPIPQTSSSSWPFPWSTAQSLSSPLPFPFPLAVCLHSPLFHPSSSFPLPPRSLSPYSISLESLSSLQLPISLLPLHSSPGLFSQIEMDE